MRSRITKDIFKKAIQCPTLGWYSARDEAKALTPGEVTRVREGRDVGARALSLFPSGVLVAGPHDDAVKETAALLPDSTVAALFEPAFGYEVYAARADALQRHPSGAGFILSEVKSSVHKDDDIKKEHIDEIAYTVTILRKSGVNVVATEIVRLSSDWRLGMSERDLFRSQDCTEAVFERATEFEQALPTVARTIFGSERPEPTHRKFCGECEYFKNQCLGKDIE